LKEILVDVSAVLGELVDGFFGVGELALDEEGGLAERGKKKSIVCEKKEGERPHT